MLLKTTWKIEKMDNCPVNRSTKYICYKNAKITKYLARLELMQSDNSDNI